MRARALVRRTVFPLSFGKSASDNALIARRGQSRPDSTSAGFVIATRLCLDTRSRIRLTFSSRGTIYLDVTSTLYSDGMSQGVDPLESAARLNEISNSGNSIRCVARVQLSTNECNLDKSNDSLRFLRRTISRNISV